MIEPKPLAKERLKEIEAFLSQFTRLSGMSQIAADLFGDARYWRNAVKNAEWNDGTIRYHGDNDCLWCGANISASILCDENGVEVEQHKPDCPWLLSQESEA